MTYYYSDNGSSEGEDSDVSDSPSPPPFDRSRKPSLSILKKNSGVNKADEIIDVDSDTIVDANKYQSGTIKSPAKRAHFEEPLLVSN